MASVAMIDKLAQMDAERRAGATPVQLARRYRMQLSSVYQLLSLYRRRKIEAPVVYWNEEMDGIIRKHWRVRNAGQIARIISKLHRPVTEHAVNARARRLGLEKPGSPQQWWTINLDPMARST